MGCQTAEIEEDKLGNFDISPDVKTIVFSYYKKGISSIYTANIDGSNVRLLLSQTDSSFVNPAFSPDGNRIIYIKHKKGIWSGLLSMADLNGKSRQTLIKQPGLITEAVFLTDSRIVFCLANEYDSYSPLANKDAHGFDLYALNVTNKSIVKLSKLDAFGLNQLARKDSSHLLIHIEGSMEDSGVYMFSMNQKNSLRRIRPKNDPRDGIYYNSSYNSNSKSLVLVAPYEIYTMHLDSMIAKVMYESDSHIQNIKFADEKLVFFSKHGEFNTIFKMNLTSDILSEIKINSIP